MPESARNPVARLASLISPYSLYIFLLLSIFPISFLSSTFYLSQDLLSYPTALHPSWSPVPIVYFSLNTAYLTWRSLSPLAVLFSVLYGSQLGALLPYSSMFYPTWVLIPLILISSYMLSVW